MPPGFQALLGPGTIGTMQLRNRIVMPPMVRNYAATDGTMTRRLIDHYGACARGGVGLIIVEATCVHQSGRGWYHQIGIHDDRCLSGLSDLTEAVRGWGSKIAVQLHHAGRQTSASITGQTIVAPSAIPTRPLAEVPRELTVEEIAQLVEAFAQGARRAKQARFDAVELHGAHGYLINQFLSPHTNRRTDKYGGDLSGRMTFLLEVIQRTRSLVGRAFPIIVRLNGEDLGEYGLKIDDTKQIAKRLQSAGVDALHISVGAGGGQVDPRAVRMLGANSMYAPRGQLVPYAEQVKKAVDIPVITVGSITPEMGEDILRKGKADFIAMGRSLLTDPELPNKLVRGNPEEIRPCIRCNECSGSMGFGVRCSINAEVGFESEGIKPPLRRKKVLVIGGGPAGLEAARVAALRGHEVTLYEKNEQLGGHLNEAAVPAFKEDLRHYRDWLTRQVRQLGVKIETRKATVRTVTATRPDALVIATGSVAVSPGLPGVDRTVVTTIGDILLGKSRAGSKNIIVGGNANGCDLALHLAQQGKQATIVETSPEVATDAPPVRSALLSMLVLHNVEILTGVQVTGITDGGITAIDQNRNSIGVSGDRVILVTEFKPQDELWSSLRSRVPEVYMIGDCATPRRIADAVREGFRVGNSL